MRNNPSARPRAPRATRLERRPHRALHVQHLDVLPVLLQQRREEIARELNVERNVRLRHLDVADGDIEAHHFLHLEFDGRAHRVDLVLQIRAAVDQRREFAGLGEARAEQARNLLDERVRREEGVVLLGELLDDLLVLPLMLIVLLLLLCKSLVNLLLFQ